MQNLFEPACRLTGNGLIKKLCRLFSLPWAFFYRPDRVDPDCLNYLKTMLKAAFFSFVCAVLSTISMPANAQILSKGRPVKLLALGDSYTIGESVAELQRWPVQLVQGLKEYGYTCYDPQIIAATGWRTDDLKKAIQSGNLPKDFNLVSLLIGVNNQFQGKTPERYGAEFDELLNSAIQYAGGDAARVLVLSIPDYGYTPFGKEQQATISRAIDAFNAINRSIAEKKNVVYIDITDISRLGLKDPSLVSPDGLHPSGKMYSEWVRRILERIR